MKQTISLWLILLALCTSLHAQAKAYTTDEIPMVHLQDRTRYVSNPDGILSQETVTAIDTTLYALEKETGIQTLVVVVKSIEGGDCFDFAYRLGKENGVGQKKTNSGLVILLATEDRCIQFATGYGLEGDLPDAICKRIQERYMNVPFGQGKWDEGMKAGIQAIRKQLTGTGTPLFDNNGDEEADPLFLLLAFGCIALIFVVSGALARKASKCPACGKHKLQRVSSQVVARTGNTTTEEVTYVCKNCGYKIKRIEKKENDDDYRHRGGGTFFGGPIGGIGSGSGGFGGGGSFGGGSFGGGGAGSKF